MERRIFNVAKQIANEKEAIFAEEAFVVDVQILLNQIMKEKGFSRADLARAMNVSRARITQIFSDECKNFTVRLLARAMHAMGETPELTCELYAEELRRNWESDVHKLARAASNVLPMSDYETNEAEWCWCANDNNLAGAAPHYRMVAA